MSYDELIVLFSQFGLAVFIGVLIGIEREMREGGSRTMGIRDFIFFSVIGALSAYLAQRFDAIWIIALSFVGLLAIVLSGYWADRKHGPGITTELAAFIVFFLGVLIMFDAQVLAIALAILTLGVLFPKAAINDFARKISAHEMKAILLFLTISFIVLPILPNQTLDHFATFDAGVISELEAETQR
ncbi:MAG: MgtC/SapB family protein, partial [Gammaproteobacteria bacterium]